MTIENDNNLCPPCEPPKKNKLIIPRKQGLIKYRTWNNNTHEIIELLTKKNPIEVKKDDRFNKEKYEQHTAEQLERIENTSKDKSMLSFDEINENKDLTPT